MFVIRNQNSNLIHNCAECENYIKNIGSWAQYGFCKENSNKIVLDSNIIDINCPFHTEATKPYYDTIFGEEVLHKCSRCDIYLPKSFRLTNMCHPCFYEYTKELVEHIKISKRKHPERW